MADGSTSTTLQSGLTYQNCLQSLKGKFVKNGEESMEELTSEDLLKNDYIGLLFTASWSPPCKLFVPLLVESYKKIRQVKGDTSFEIVLVTHDRQEKDWKHFFATMPWVSLPWSDVAAANALKINFNVGQIPRLVIIGNDGNILMENARGGEHGFGFGCDPLKAYDAIRNCTAKEGKAGAKEEKGIRKSEIGGSMTVAVDGDGS
eukprot:gnl/MRDRNA2_/MRDRNA2_99767_c0_seq1.p1 gnl/MRDRNA2_/MRDRNA2_99767_c0~~gnl/MRDRNA2_/MRDRNA2_99767_c0_seq1.p1  ORF type:complete len:215 (+),score=48.23 gnl/MRDRNA2_/MRDRNA2_99767_c0_seq1:34-645(+)